MQFWSNAREKLYHAEEIMRKLKVTISRIIRRKQSPTPAKLMSFCARCGQETEIISRVEASKLLQTSQNTLDDMIYAGVIHVIHAVNNSPWICKNSLFPKAGEDEMKKQILGNWEE
jgi:hypothetical protein